MYGVRNIKNEYINSYALLLHPNAPIFVRGWSGVIENNLMLKEIKVVDEKKGIARVTTVDERWYFKTIMNPETGLPETKFFPSSTWIISCYPKGKWLAEWREEVGKEEADRVKKAAGSRGSKVHYACEDIDRGRLFLYLQ